MCLVVSRHVLNYSRPATVKLQMKERDILEGYKLLEVLRSTRNHVINDIDHYHQLCYDEALNLATILNVEKKISPIPQVSIYRDNPPAESSFLYYKYSLTLPTLNDLLTQVDERCKESSKPYRDAMQIILDLMITAHYKNVDWRAPIFQFVEKFDNDIPHSGSIRPGLDMCFIFRTDQFTGNRPD